jgi:hypothetical protein
MGAIMTTVKHRLSSRQRNMEFLVEFEVNVLAQARS